MENIHILTTRHFLWPDACFLALGRTLSSTGRLCSSPSAKLRTGSASWADLLSLVSALSDGAREGVTGFGYFCQNNNRRALQDASGKSSAAEPKTGNTQTCESLPGSRMMRSNRSEIIQRYYRRRGELRAKNCNASANVRYSRWSIFPESEGSDTWGNTD